MLKRLMLLLNILIVANNLYCPVEYTLKSFARMKLGFRLILNIRACNFDRAYELIDKCSDINVRDSELRTPLIYAIMFAHLGLTNKLIEAGADVNAKDIYGITPLIMAKSKKLDSIVQLLIEKDPIE